MNEVTDDARRAKLRRLNELNQEMLAHVELAREETLKQLEERWGFKPQPMLEKEIEKYFVWTVERMGGKTWKFTSPGRKGVADRIACLPDGTTWFVELKTKGGRLSPLQKLFADDVLALNQRYACLWTKEQIDGFVTTVSRAGR
jgi:hypothetical protein